MELNEDQDKAMGTCLPSSENFAYMLIGLTAEVGEINDKVAKWIRKGIARMDDNHLVFNTSDEQVRDAYLAELKKEVGDCLWFIAGLANVMRCELDDLAWDNIGKLASRKQRGVIDGNGDNR